MSTITSILNGKELVRNRAAAGAILVVSFVMMLTLGAYIRIPVPFTPVPVTMQTFFVILAGAVLGRKLGLFTVFSYITLGAFGIPVFQGYGGGILHILGPTGGYLAGFMLSAYLVGYLSEIRRSAGFTYILFSMLLGLLVIYVSGLLWLSVSLGVGLKNAVYMGLLPFLPGAIAKLVAASWVYYRIRTRTNELV